MIPRYPQPILAAAFVATLTFACTHGAVAQDAAEQVDPPIAQEEVAAQDDEDGAKQDDAAEGDGDASLDELLGLEDEESERAHDTAEAQRDAELERALNEQRIEDNFKEAIALMTSSAELLSEEFDSGLGTQRVQEEIIKKLDDLINSARNQQSSSSSSSSSQQRNSQQQPRPQQQSSNQDSQSQDQNSNQPLQGEATTVQQPPDEAADIRELLDESRIEWGALPERERELLMQAMTERPSSMYRRLTSDYFKKLAESD